MIIDAHAHPVFAGTPVHPGVHSLSHTYYSRSALEITLPDYVKELDRARVDRAVLLTVAWKNGPVRQRNEATAEIVDKYPDRLIGFAAFDPNAGDQAVAELGYAANELRLRGAKIVAQNVEMFYNDPRYYPIYAKIEELGIPIMFHTGPSFLGTRSQYGEPSTLDDVALAFPKMKIIVAHLGMHRFMDAHSLLVRHPNVSADLSFWPLHRAYRGLIPWQLFEETVSEKLLMGSDFPVGQSPIEAVETVKSLPIGDRFKAQILGENAAKLLGI
ncbi:MAG TPA: amidohydrolase family protein [Candidatus Binatia bacterium]|nr:amidohydrolase family protein [Candidatus Binatia bacterium]